MRSADVVPMCVRATYSIFGGETPNEIGRSVLAAGFGKWIKPIQTLVPHKRVIFWLYT